MWEKLNHNIDKMLMLTKNLLLAVEKQHQKLLNNDKELTEEVFKVSSALAVGMAFGALIGPISDEVGNRSAKRQAKKIKKDSLKLKIDL